MVKRVLTWAKAGDYDLDELENPSRDLVIKAFEMLSRNNMEMDLLVNNKWLLIATDTSETRYIVSLGNRLIGDRLVDSILYDKETDEALKLLEFPDDDGIGPLVNFKYTISEHEARRVLLYFFQHGKLPDDVRLFTYE